MLTAQHHVTSTYFTLTGYRHGELGRIVLNTYIPRTVRISVQDASTLSGIHALRIILLF